MLLEIVDKLISLMGPIATLSKEKRELKDSALRAISIALQETKLYYRDLENGSERDMDVEAQLVRYWGAAAIPLRHIDEELAMICEHKSEYWLTPKNYSNKQINELGIKLQDVSYAYRNLAMPKFGTRLRDQNT